MIALQRKREKEGKRKRLTPREESKGAREQESERARERESGRAGERESKREIEVKRGIFSSQEQRFMSDSLLCVLTEN